MLKRISSIALVALLGMGAVTFCYPKITRAGTYKLDYPQGYGTCCPSNAKEFGYFRTGWREWPGEIRRDKTFPRSIGMEVLPAPQGQEIIPPPKAAAPPKVPGETPLEPETKEGTAQPSEEMPGKELLRETPALPKTPTLTLPELPQEKEEFNPLPGLPPDLNAPSPLNPQEKEENNPSTESKKESDLKDEATEKNKIENPVPDSKSEDKGAEIKLPLNRDLTRYSSDIVRGAIYHEPAESPMSARLSRDITPQSYLKTSASDEGSAVVRGGSQTDAPANELRGNALPLALDGFCPVELSLHGRWSQGDQRWSVAYKGLIYRFSGNAQRQEFASNPEKYIPANNGFDPVISAAEKRNVPGQVNFCAAYKGRIYMFSSAAAQEYFHKNPELYVGAAIK